MEIVEIEKGPHFLTFYANNRAELISWLPNAYRLFMKDPQFQTLQAVQQEGFIHVTNDPNVYHPYGDPDNFKKDYSHFHIRTIEEPSEGLISALTAFSRKAGAKCSDTVLRTNLEDNKLPDRVTWVYPVRSVGEDYLEYINRVRETNGQYNH